MAKKYSIIYADPPWRYNQKGVSGAAEKHYPTMSIEELCALPVAEISASDSVLFLWTTFPQLPSALQLIKAWGFSYKTVGFVWLKKTASQIAGFVEWAFGQGEMQKFASWPQKGIRSGKQLMFINLLFRLSGNTAGSRMKLGKKLLRSWVIYLA